MQYESIFIRYVQQHTADLLEDLQVLLLVPPAPLHTC